jgi:hypothetical protein
MSGTFFSKSFLPWIILYDTPFFSILVIGKEHNTHSDKVTFNNISTTDLPQITDNLYHIMLYTSPWVGVEPTTSVVIGTDCIGSWWTPVPVIQTITSAITWVQQMFFTVKFQTTNRPWYSWNIVESGVRHHKSNLTLSLFGFFFSRAATKSNSTYNMMNVVRLSTFSCPKTSA